MDEIMISQQLMSPKKAIKFFEFGTSNPSSELLEMVENENIVFEEKIDGTRAVVVKKGDSVKIYGRGTVQFFEGRKQSDYTEKFPELVKEFKKANIDFILDGEIVVYDKNGKSDFGAVQGRTTRTEGIQLLASSKPATYIAFDIILFGEKDLIETKDSFEERINYMTSLFISHMRGKSHNRIIQIYFAKTKIEKQIMVDKIVEQEQVEGLMIKDLREPYVYGASNAWCKAKKTYTEDVFVMGCHVGTGKRWHNNWFGALHCYQMLNGTPVHVTTVGGGFDDNELEEFSRLVDWDLSKPLSGYKAREALANAEPGSVFVIEVEHYGWMKDSIRHPNFIRVREDKTPEDCKRELPVEGTLDDFF